MPTGSGLLSGVNSCFAGGNSEPVLDQLLPALGYTTVVDTQFIDRRYIGPLALPAGHRRDPVARTSRRPTRRSR